MPDPAQLTDPLKPEASLLVKLGSIAVHADEGLGSHGHQFDLNALSTLLSDPEVIDWLDAMGTLALLPVKRDA